MERNRGRNGVIFISANVPSIGAVNFAIINHKTKIE